MNGMLKSLDVVRAWRDIDYCRTLTDEQLAALPANPIGELRAVDVRGREARGESIVVSIISPAGCGLTLACTGHCCAW